MNTKQIISVLVVVVIAGGVWWFLAKAPAPASTDTQTMQASTFAEEGTTTSTKVDYPAAPAAERAAIETSLAQDVADFRQSTDGLDATVLPSLADGHKLMFTAEYKAYTGADTASYFYTIYEDTGGAHPNAYFKTFVFDAQGTRLALADVLKNNPNWLQELSLLVSNDVVKQYKERAQVDDTTGLIYDEGLAPKEENFQNWYLDGDTLVIEIPPYQVAAYVLGSFEVRIPLADINH